VYFPRSRASIVEFEVLSRDLYGCGMWVTTNLKLCAFSMGLETKWKIQTEGISFYFKLFFCLDIFYKKRFTFLNSLIIDVFNLYYESNILII
jgi:hypothetical protein